jgi:hypothetical protein
MQDNPGPASKQTLEVGIDYNTNLGEAGDGFLSLLSGTSRCLTIPKRVISSLSDDLMRMAK